MGTAIFGVYKSYAFLSPYLSIVLLFLLLYDNSHTTSSCLNFEQPSDTNIGEYGLRHLIIVFAVFAFAFTLSIVIDIYVRSKTLNESKYTVITRSPVRNAFTDTCALYDGIRNDNLDTIRITDIDRKLMEARASLHDSTPFISTMCRLNQSNEILRKYGASYTNNLLRIDERKFHFDHVFGPDDSQNDVFDKLRSMIDLSITGMPFIFIATGASGSGKTYTLMGKQNIECDSDGDLGLIGRAILHLLNKITTDQYISVNAVEISANGLRDLLSGSNEYSTATNVFVNRIVKRESDVLHLICKIRSRRSTTSTALNAASSRTHLILNLSIGNSTGPSNHLLTWVDLAGYEPSNSSTLISTGFINGSLASLQRILMSLIRRDEKPAYRTSTLTQYLRKFLVTNCKIILMATVSFSKLSVRGNSYAIRTVSTFTGKRRTKCERKRGTK